MNCSSFLPLRMNTLHSLYPPPFSLSLLYILFKKKKSILESHSMAISHQLDESKFSFSRFARPTQRRNKTPPPPSMHGLLVDLEHQRHRSRHRTAEGLLAGKRGWKTRSIRGPVARSGCLQPREACVRDRSGRRRRRRIRGSSREEDKFTS